MGDFFHGWRRKAGSVTLAIACVFMAGWVRSLVATDYLFFPARSGLPARYDDLPRNDNENDMTIGLWSCNGSLAVEYALDAIISGIFFDSETSWSIHELGFCHPGLAEFTQCRGQWRWRWMGFGVAQSQNSLMRTTIWIVPYWSFAVPPTLLSAYLLLSKPRTTTQMKITEPMANEEA